MSLVQLFVIVTHLFQCKKKIEKKKKTHDCKFIKHIKSHFETADQIFFFLAFPPNFVSYHLFHIEVSWSHFVRYY